MYNTEKNPGFNVKDVIIKAIFLVLFILLLVWLFPKVPNMKPFYSNVFRENIKYMQEAAESYYTTERLPKNVGDTAEMTLQDMIDKNLILPFVDEDGNSCDTKESYVEVKKNKNDYTLKVNLVCPNEENYVDKILGCYQYCEGDNCKEENKPVTAIEYQFKQTGSKDVSYYTCPDGGTLTNGICNIYTTDTYKATVTTTKGNEYCPNGGELKDGVCYKVETTSYDATEGQGKYYCPNGGILNGTKCYVNNSTSYEAAEKLSCPNGGSLVGNKCVIEGSGDSSYAASVRYSCPNGGDLSGTKCIITSQGSSSSYAASVRYSCPNGGSLSGTKCITSSGTSGSSYAATKSTTKQTLSGQYTTKPSGYTCSTTRVKTCSTCTTYKTVYTSCYKYTTTYTCPKGGSLRGTTCYISGTSGSSYTASKSYYCPDGGSLSGSTCYVKGETSSSSYTASKSYYCPNGGSLSGSTCYVSGSGNESYTPSRNYTCPNGGKLSGTKCIVEESTTYNATKSQGEKYCPNGGTLSGDKCIVTKTNSYKASVSDGTSVKTCPNGGTLKDDGLCYVNKLSKSYKATLNTKKQYYTNYKWSREESIPGWTRTGETRTVTVGNTTTTTNKQK